VATRFIALSTDDLRSMLERAWDACPAETPFFDYLKSLEVEAAEIARDNVQNSSSNGHSSGAFMPGENKPTETEEVRGYRRLIDEFRKNRSYLRYCSKYGFDAFSVKQNGQFPSPPAALAADLRVIVDDDANWELLCEQFDLATGDVVGVVVGDEAVFLWIMDNLFPVTEGRSDYSQLLTIAGGVE